MNDPQYSITLWGSHPDLDNDDCWYGEDFDTLNEAMVKFNEPVTDRSIAFIMIDGPGINGIRLNPTHKPLKDDRGEWRREQAMEAGMLHGVDAYNDMMEE